MTWIEISLLSILTISSCFGFLLHGNSDIDHSSV